MLTTCLSTCLPVYAFNWTFFFFSHSLKCQTGRKTWVYFELFLSVHYTCPSYSLIYGSLVVCFALYRTCRAGSLRRRLHYVYAWVLSPAATILATIQQTKLGKACIIPVGHACTSTYACLINSTCYTYNSYEARTITKKRLFTVKKKTDRFLTFW